MNATVQGRMFDRLLDLIPQLPMQAEGATFFAAPRQKDDMSLYCNINSKSGSVVELEIANDLAVPGQPGETTPAPWMKFALNMEERTAELVCIQENDRFEKVCAADNPHRKIGLNMFAVNWLNILINLQFAFVPVAQVELIA